MKLSKDQSLKINPLINWFAKYSLLPRQSLPNKKNSHISSEKSPDYDCSSILPAYYFASFLFIYLTTIITLCQPWAPINVCLSQVPVAETSSTGQHLYLYAYIPYSIYLLIWLAIATAHCLLRIPSRFFFYYFLFMSFLR